MEDLGPRRVKNRSTEPRKAETKKQNQRGQELCRQGLKSRKKAGFLPREVRSPSGLQPFPLRVTAKPFPRGNSAEEESWVPPFWLSA